MCVMTKQLEKMIQNLQLICQNLLVHRRLKTQQTLLTNPNKHVHLKTTPPTQHVQ